MTADRTRIRPPKWDIGWPDTVTVECGPPRPAPCCDRTEYDLFVDDVKVGVVYSAVTESSVPTGPGGRLRRVTGHPKRWTVVAVTSPGRRSSRWETRAAAVAMFMREYLGKGGEPHAG